MRIFSASLGRADLIPLAALTVLLAAPVTDDIGRLPKNGSTSIATVAADQIFNEAGGGTLVVNSIVEAGLSQGTLDGGNNVDAEPGFADANGVDQVSGTIDDDYRLTGQSIAVDAGDNDLVVADRFDVDGDGNTGEILPIDHSGAARIADAENGGVVDLGAYEYGSGAVVGREPDPSGGRRNSLSVYPMPAGDTFRLELALSQPADARIVIHDVLGRHVRTCFEGPVSESREIQVSTQGLASGVYIIVLESEGLLMTEQLVVVDG